ncbi:MAG: hypothetical protein AABX71_01470, partial [Nanoarchaeota archaeon]
MRGRLSFPPSPVETPEIFAREGEARVQPITPQPIRFQPQPKVSTYSPQGVSRQGLPRKRGSVMDRIIQQRRSKRLEGY